MATNGGETYCQQCGHNVDPAARFCGQCGAERATNGAGSIESPGRNPHGNSPTESRSGSSTGVVTDVSKYTLGQKAVLGGSVVVIAGAFFPWVSIEIFGTEATVTGIDGDGAFTLLFGLVIVAVLLKNGPGTWESLMWWAAVVLAGLTTVIGLLYVNDPMLGVDSADETAQIIANVGSGVYLTMLGGIVTVIGLLLDK